MTERRTLDSLTILAIAQIAPQKQSRIHRSITAFIGIKAIRDGEQPQKLEVKEL